MDIAAANPILASSLLKHNNSHPRSDLQDSASSLPTRSKFDVDGLSDSLNPIWQSGRIIGIGTALPNDSRSENKVSSP